MIFQPGMNSIDIWNTRLSQEENGTGPITTCPCDKDLQLCGNCSIFSATACSRLAGRATTFYEFAMHTIGGFSPTGPMGIMSLTIYDVSFVPDTDYNLVELLAESQVIGCSLYASSTFVIMHHLPFATNGKRKRERNCSYVTRYYLLFFSSTRSQCIWPSIPRFRRLASYSTGHDK